MMLAIIYKYKYQELQHCVKELFIFSDFTLSATCIVSEIVSEDISVLDLYKVDTSRNLITLQVSDACSLIELIEDIYHLEFRPGCAFCEFTHKHEDIGPKKEIILMDKVSSFLM